MDDRITYRDIREMKLHYCRENDNIVGLFGSNVDDEHRSSDSGEETARSTDE